MKNKITVTGANITFFAFAVAFIAYQFFLVIPAVFMYGGDSKKFALDNFVWITLISEYLIILVPVFTFVLVKRLKVKEVFRLNNPGLLPCLIIALIAVPASYAADALNTIVLYLLSFLGDVSRSPIPVPKDASGLITGLFVIAVTPAICEELLNRGILMSAYEKRGTMKAVVISALFFGVFHFDITNLAGPIFLGLLIGYYVIKTNSIFSGMLAHFLNNAYAIIMMYSLKNENLPEKINISTPDLAYSLFFGVIALVIIFLLLKLLNNVTKSRESVRRPPISSIKGDVVSIVSHWPVIVVICLYGFINLLNIAAIAFSAV